MATEYTEGHIEVEVMNPGPRRWTNVPHIYFEEGPLSHGAMLFAILCWCYGSEGVGRVAAVMGVSLNGVKRFENELIKAGFARYVQGGDGERAFVLTVDA